MKEKTVNSYEMEEIINKKLAFLKLDPENPKLLSEIAHIYIQQGKVDDALFYIDRGLNVFPDNPELIFVKATLAIASNQPNDAITYLEQLKAAVGSVPELHYNLAYAHMLKGNAIEAINELSPIVNDTSLNPSFLLLLARAYHHIGRIEDAEKYVVQYLSQFPLDIEALGMMALLRLDAEEKDAIDWAEKVLSIDGSNIPGLITKGNVALNNLNKTEAEHCFHKAVDSDSSSGRAHAGLGLIYLSDMKLEQATDELEKAVLFIPDHIGTWHALAWSQILGDDLAGAKKSFERANDIDRNFGETYGGLAVIAALEGNIEDARTLIKKALRLNPQSFSARYAKSLIIASTGDSEQAAKMNEHIIGEKIYEDGATLKEMLFKLQSGV